MPNFTIFTEMLAKLGHTYQITHLWHHWSSDSHWLHALLRAFRVSSDDATAIKKVTKIFLLGCKWSIDSCFVTKVTLIHNINSRYHIKLYHLFNWLIQFQFKLVSLRDRLEPNRISIFVWSLVFLKSYFVTKSKKSEQIRYNKKTRA